MEVLMDEQDLQSKQMEFQKLLINTQEKEILEEIYQSIYYFLLDMQEALQIQSLEYQEFFQNLVIFIAQLQGDSVSEYAFKIAKLLIKSTQTSFIYKELLLNYLQKLSYLDIRNKFSEWLVMASTKKSINLENNLEKLFQSNKSLEEKYLGFSILSTTGEFLYCDKLTQKYLEIKKTQKWQKYNFFDLMIPYSINHLRHLYSQGNKDLVIFDQNCQPGSSTVFSYVIYSKKNRDKVLLNFSKTKRRIVHIDQETQPENKNYFLYLQALVSQFTIVLLDLKTLNSQTLDPQYFNQQLIQDLTLESKQSIIPVIYLKTKLSNQIPQYPYQQMDQDPIIKQFKSFINKKISKKSSQIKLFIIMDFQQEKSNSENEDLDQALIESSINQSKPKMNLSFNEKEELGEIDDEEIEQEFTDFLKEINQPGESNIFQQMSKIMDSDIFGQSDVQNETGDPNGFEDFSNRILEKMVNKETLYQPLKKVQQKLISFQENENQQPNNKIILIQQVLDIFDQPNWEAKENKQEIIRLFEQLNDNQTGGIPDKIFEEQQQENPELNQFKNLMSDNCSIFQLITQLFLELQIFLNQFPIIKETNKSKNIPKGAITNNFFLSSIN